SIREKRCLDGCDHTLRDLMSSVFLGITAAIGETHLAFSLVALELMRTREMEGRVNGDQDVTFQSCHPSTLGNVATRQQSIELRRERTVGFFFIKYSNL
ncbi:unnamed protein product, partial [Brassica rapa subsp. trilocularis]